MNTKLGDFVNLGVLFLTIVANPIIYRLVPTPSRYEIRQLSDYRGQEGQVMRLIYLPCQVQLLLAFQDVGGKLLQVQIKRKRKFNSLLMVNCIIVPYNQSLMGVILQNLSLDKMLSTVLISEVYRTNSAHKSSNR